MMQAENMTTKYSIEIAVKISYHGVRMVLVRFSKVNPFAPVLLLTHIEHIVYMTTSHNIFFVKLIYVINNNEMQPGPSITAETGFSQFYGICGGKRRSS